MRLSKSYFTFLSPFLNPPIFGGRHNIVRKCLVNATVPVRSLTSKTVATPFSCFLTGCCGHFNSPFIYFWEYSLISYNIPRKYRPLLGISKSPRLLSYHICYICKGYIASFFTYHCIIFRRRLAFSLVFIPK